MSIVTKRKPTRQIHIGPIAIGGGAPIAVQSMTNTSTQDVEATAAQIERLEKSGCEVVRVAVPDEEAANAIRRIKKRIHIPLIADIHFDHRLALAAARAGADGLRLNPGNIGGREKIREVVRCAKDLGLPIRIGVNSGSIETELLHQHGRATAEAMVVSALRHVALLEDMDFHAIKISLKASDVSRTLSAYRLLSEKTDYPLHVGVTEAGGLYSGIVKSSLGIGMLLAEGIGDTIRVSLTRDPVEEIRVGFEILRALDLRSRGPEIISCPTCGRCRIHLFDIAEQVEKALMYHPSSLKVAIMGCTVNGPGEAREADVGIAGGDGFGVLFMKGKVIRKVPQEQMIDALLAAVAACETPSGSPDEKDIS